MLSERFREHLLDIRNELQKPVAIHFTQSDHNVTNIRVTGISQLNGNTSNRKQCEMQIIHHLGTLEPHGINKKISFVI